MNKVPMTEKGYQDLQDELKKLINKDRPKIITAISEARSHGDLSENAEYQYAKEQQSLIEGKIQELEATTALAEVIDKIIETFKSFFSIIVFIAEPKLPIKKAIIKNLNPLVSKETIKKYKTLK